MSERQRLLEAVSIRTRGYARYLAVGTDDRLPYADVGRYILPNATNLQNPYLEATIEHENDEVGTLYSLSLSNRDRAQDPFDEAFHSITTGSEATQAGQLTIWSPNYYDPRNTETITLAMARKTLLMLDEFDKIIPNLIPDPVTARAITEKFVR